MGVLSHRRLRSFAISSFTVASNEVDLHPLVVYSQPSSARSARLRVLAQEVFARVHASPAIAIVPAVRGRTTSLVLNIAYALAEANHRVAVIEADLRSPRMSDQLNLLAPVVGFAEVLNGQAPLAAAEQHITDRLTIVTSSDCATEAVSLLNSSTLQDVIKDMSSRHDVTFVVCPPSVDHLDYSFIARACDGIIVVAQKDRSRMPDVVALRDEIERMSVPLVYALLDN